MCCSTAKTFAESSTSLASYCPPGDDLDRVPLSEEEDDEPDGRQPVKQQLKVNSNSLKLSQKWARLTAPTTTAPAPFTAAWRRRPTEPTMQMAKSQHARASRISSPSSEPSSPAIRAGPDDASANQDSDKVFAPRSCELWTVMTNAGTSLEEKGYHGNFKRKVLDLPFPFSIRTPRLLFRNILSLIMIMIVYYVRPSSIAASCRRDCEHIQLLIGLHEISYSLDL